VSRTTQLKVKLARGLIRDSRPCLGRLLRLFQTVHQGLTQLAYLQQFISNFELCDWPFRDKRAQVKAPQLANVSSTSGYIALCREDRVHVKAPRLTQLSSESPTLGYSSASCRDEMAQTGQGAAAGEWNGAPPCTCARTNQSTALCTDTPRRQWSTHMASARSSCSSFALRITSITSSSVKRSAAQGLATSYIVLSKFEEIQSFHSSIVVIKLSIFEGVRL